MAGRPGGTHRKVRIQSRAIKAQADESGVSLRIITFSLLPGIVFAFKEKAAVCHPKFRRAAGPARCAAGHQRNVAGCPLARPALVLRGYSWLLRCRARGLRAPAAWGLHRCSGPK